MNNSMERVEMILVDALQSLRHARRLILSYPRVDGLQEYVQAKESYLRRSEELREDMSKRAKIAFICGQRTGLEHSTRTWQAEEYVRSIGLHIIGCAGTSHTSRDRIRALTEADMLILLDGWEESRESRIEAKLAFDLGIEVVQLGILKILMGHS